MRITQNIIRRDAFASMQQHLRSLSEAQAEVSTGLRIRRVSDDPVAGAEVLRTGQRLRALEQYGRNIEAADARLRSEEGVLGSLTDLLARAKELAISQGGDTASSDTRALAAKELDHLLGLAIELGNTRFGEGYLFGGGYTDRRPFDPAADGATDPDHPPVGSQSVEIGISQTFAVTHDGKAVFEDSGVLQSLITLRDALQANDQSGVANATTALDGAHRSVQTLLGDVGARTRRLEMAAANIDALDQNLRTLRSDLEDAEMEEAVTTLVNRQVAYQSALLATSRILHTTLTDYLR